MKRSATSAQLALPWASPTAAPEPAPMPAPIVSVTWAPPTPPEPEPEPPAPEPASVTEAPAPVTEGPDLIAQFVGYRKAKNQSERTQEGSHYDLRVVERALGVPLLEATSKQLLAHFAQEMARVSSGTVKRHMANVRSFWRWAMLYDLTTVDPTVKLEAPKSGKRLHIYLTEAEAERLQAYMDAARTSHDLRDAAALALLRYTGMRAGELLALDVESWQARTEELRVIGKGDKERIIPVPPQLVPYVERWLAVHPVGSGPMFVRWRSPWKRLKYAGFLDLWNKAKRACQLRDVITPHKLRHTYATWALRAGVPIDQVGKLLGHADISTTQIYADTIMPPGLGAKLGEALH